MELGGFSNGAYRFCSWFYKLAYLNILWIFFTILGLIIFGFFPATIALLATLRQVLKGNDTQIGKSFWHYYKIEFAKSNIFGFIVIVISSLLYLNINYLIKMGTQFSEILYYPTLIMCGICFLTVCYTLVSFVEFEQRLFIHIKNSFLIMIYNPIPNVFIIFGFAAVYFANTFISGLGFFFSISLLALVMLSSSHLAYRKIQRNVERLQTE